MKKKIVVGGLFLLLSGLGFYFAGNKVKVTAVDTATDEPVKSEVRPTLKNSKYLVSKNLQVRSSFPTECHSSLSDLSNMLMEDYKDLVLAKEAFITFLGEKCYEQLKNNNTFISALQNTGCNLLDEKAKKINEACMGSMLVLKAHFIAENSFGKKLNEMDSQELAANFVKMLFGLDKLNRESFLENLKLADALYEKHSDDENVLEAYVGYMLVGKEVTKESSVEQKIDELLEKNKGKSFKVDRMRILREALNNKMESAKSTLDSLNETYPKEPDIAYYYASYYWKKGDRGMANDYLDRAIDLSHSCSYCNPSAYRDTKNRLAKAKPGDNKIFSLSIGLNFENL